MLGIYKLFFFKRQIKSLIISWDSHVSFFFNLEGVLWVWSQALSVLFLRLNFGTLVQHFEDFYGLLEVLQTHKDCTLYVLLILQLLVKLLNTLLEGLNVGLGLSLLGDKALVDSLSRLFLDNSGAFDCRLFSAIIKGFSRTYIFRSYAWISNWLLDWSFVLIERRFNSLFSKTITIVSLDLISHVYLAFVFLQG